MLVAKSLLRLLKFPCFPLLAGGGLKGRLKFPPIQFQKCEYEEKKAAKRKKEKYDSCRKKLIF